MIKVGLTGSIGMGKSTTAEFFRKLGCSVFDSDKVVHELYSGRAAPRIEDAFPGTVVDGVVDRKKLLARVVGNSKNMSILERIIHPLVREETQKFFEDSKKCGAKIALVDIPLLFETGAENQFDRVVVVTADERHQRDRVLSREGMTREVFQDILSRQLPDADKRKKADFLVDTGRGLEAAEAQVKAIIEKLSEYAN